MRLSLKVILITGFTVTFIITVLFVTLISRIESQNDDQILAKARSIYNNVIITRHWLADHEGVLVRKKPGIKPNLFLKHPELFTKEGDTLFLRNPAMVTRELSELSESMGGDFSYHLASEKFINPLNKPDDFEAAALSFFHDSTKNVQKNEYYRIENRSGKKYFRYFAPLFTEETCLSCHAEQGYKLGDLRGGISVLLNIESILEARQSNIIFFVILAFLSISVLVILIFSSIQKSVIKPLRIIEDSTQNIEEGKYNINVDIQTKDEIGSLAKALRSMSKKIQRDTERMKLSEEKYRSLIENSLESIAVINPEGIIIECNSKMTALTQYTNSEIKMINFFELIDTHKKQIIHTSIIKDVDEHFESVLHTKDKMNIPVEIYKLTGFVLGNVKNLSFVYVRDLSERKQIEKYAIQSEKIFALGQLSSGIAHEIRNPLFALNNNIEFLNTKFRNNQDFSDIHPELKISIDRINKIVSTILDYARPHNPDFRTVDLLPIIDSSLTLVSKQLEENSIKIEKEFVDDNLFINADAHQLGQVFVNLFLNSFKAMGNAGILKIITINGHNIPTVIIEDTGKGIPNENLQRVFDPFYSTFTDGTGLGLAIVQRILDQHNAEYHIESEENYGTRFFIHFPKKKSNP